MYNDRRWCVVSLCCCTWREVSYPTEPQTNPVNVLKTIYWLFKCLLDCWIRCKVHSYKLNSKHVVQTNCLAAVQMSPTNKIYRKYCISSIQYCIFCAKHGLPSWFWQWLCIYVLLPLYCMSVYGFLPVDYADLSVSMFLKN